LDQQELAHGLIFLAQCQYNSQGYQAGECVIEEKHQRNNGQ